MNLSEIILSYVDDVLDIDDLENIGDYLHSVLNSENLNAQELRYSLRKLCTELGEEIRNEKNLIRREKVKAALSGIEADYHDLLVDCEIEPSDS